MNKLRIWLRDRTIDWFMGIPILLAWLIGCGIGLWILIAVMKAIVWIWRAS